jgi:hypothetical protein
METDEWQLSKPKTAKNKEKERRKALKEQKKADKGKAAAEELESTMD